MRALAFLVLAGCSSHRDPLPAADPVPMPVAVPVPASVPAPVAVPGPAPAAVPAHAVSANDGLACARTHDGHVMCWGQALSELYAKPVVAPELANIAGIATFAQGVYAWTGDGAAWRWVASIHANAHADLVAVRDVIDIAADDIYACARRRGGEVTCWNGNQPPKDISGARGAVELAVAGTHACARLPGGDVTCWAADQPAHAIAFADARGATSLSGRARGTRGDLFAAVMPSGAAFAWNGSDGKRVAMPALPAGTTRVAVGADQACAFGGTVVGCWVIDRPEQRYTQASLASARDVTVGTWVSCAVLVDASLHCWGFEENVGTGLARVVAEPTSVRALDHVVQLSASRDTTCARVADGRVACWGARQTVDSDRELYELVPTFVAGITDAVDVEVSLWESCARRTSGAITCWGHVGDKYVPPTDVPELAGARWFGAVSGEICGMNHGKLTCAFSDPYAAFPDDASRVWDGGYFRQGLRCARVTKGMACQEAYYGRGERDASPSDLGTQLDDVIDFRMPEQDNPQLCLLRANGTVVCETLNQTEYAARDDVTNVVALAPAVGGTCALTRAGGVSCWQAYNREGMPADDVAHAVPHLTDAVELVGGDYSACVRRRDGTVACWGDIQHLGIGARATTETPVVVPGVTL
ncbi:MAG TPA: hypothetical protein VMJ10_32720 [Kofleriaceae bacterium]|nr:hypothetical protein [Kofleriaceae bacterium]